MKRTIINIIGCILACFAIGTLLTADIFSVGFISERGVSVSELLDCSFNEAVFEITELSPKISKETAAPLATIGIIVIITLISTAIIALLKCFAPFVKELEKISSMKALVIIPIITTVLSILLIIMSSKLDLGEGYFLSCTPELNFYLYMILLVMVIVCDMLSHAKSIAISETKSAAVGKKASVNIDNLRQYKELLDSGAITTEEYEEMKKQILNL